MGQRLHRSPSSTPSLLISANCQLFKAAGAWPELTEGGEGWFSGSVLNRTLLGLNAPSLGSVMYYRKSALIQPTVYELTELVPLALDGARCMGVPRVAGSGNESRRSSSLI